MTVCACMYPGCATSGRCLAKSKGQYEGRPGPLIKWCSHCQKCDHSDSECWSTRAMPQQAVQPLVLPPLQRPPFPMKDWSCASDQVRSTETERLGPEGEERGARQGMRPEESERQASAPQVVELIPAGYNRPPSGEPLHHEDWNAGYEAGFADGAKASVLPAAQQPAVESPVAHLRSITHPDWLEVCESDAPGAFPVYASPTAQPAAVTRRNEEN